MKSIDGESEITLRVKRNDRTTVRFLNSMKISSYSSLSQVFDTIKANTTLSDDEVAGYVSSDEYGNLILNKSENLEVETYKGRKDYVRKIKERSSKKNRLMPAITSNQAMKIKSCGQNVRPNM